MLEAMLWSAMALLAYIYAGYPLLAIILARAFPRPVDRGPVRASVTAIITAYNEEKHIRQKIRNVLALDYQWELLDIIDRPRASSPLQSGRPTIACTSTGEEGASWRSLIANCHQPTSCQAPSLYPTRRYTPRGSNPTDSCSATLAGFGRLIPAYALKYPCAPSIPNSDTYNPRPMPYRRNS